MSSVKINGVDFSTKYVSKFKSSAALGKAVPHIWKDLENREDLFDKVYNLVKPPKTKAKKDTVKKK